MKKYLIRGVYLLLLLTLVFPLVAQETLHVEHDNLLRTYFLNIPEDYDNSTPVPLLIGLHWAGGDGLAMLQTTRFAELANENGWLAAFPTGIDAGWDYLDHEDQHPAEVDVDDIGFINTMIDEIGATYPVDEARIYIMGYSNGALLALRLSCEMNDRIDAIAAIAGTYSFEITRHCIGEPPVPLMLVWGMEDATFPTDGYVVERDGNRIRSSFSLSQTRSYINSHYGCDERPQAARVEVEGSSHPVVMEQYTDCANGTSATLFAIVGHDHSFPQRPRIHLSDGQTGDMQDAIWQFFVKQAEQ
jgi:polyhydroxybutyrate depolymerase